MLRVNLVLFSLLLANPAYASLKEGMLPSFVPQLLESSGDEIFTYDQIWEFRKNLREIGREAQALAPEQESTSTERQSQEQ